MTEFPILRDLGLILVSAAGVTLLARRVGLPHIVAYLVAGLLIGPAFHLVHAEGSVELTGEVGIALLLFLVGLELSVERIKDVGRPAIVGGTIQLAASLTIGYGIGLLLGFGQGRSAIFAIALALSSTVVAVKLLGQARALQSLHGRLAIGILLVQDLAAILALTVIAALGGGQALTAAEGALQLGRTMLGMLLLLGIAAASARWLLRPLFSRVVGSAETIFVWSLCWCFLFIVAADVLRLSHEIGAFLAGVSLAQLSFAHELRRRVETLTSFFVAVFFVILGAEMDVAGAIAAWPTVLAVSAAVVVMKLVTVSWPLMTAGIDRGSALRTGITLSQVSEFSFILVGLAASRDLIGEQVLGIVGAVGLITIVSSALLFARQDAVLRLFERLGLKGATSRPKARDAVPLSDHVIVVGMNELGLRIVDALIAAGERVLAIDTDQRKLDALPCETMLGSVEYPSVLEEARLHDAKLVVSALQIEDANALLAYRAREAGVPASIHAFDTSVVAGLEQIGVRHMLLSKNLGVRRIAMALREQGVLN